jgi:hypothetical protein
MTPCIHSAPNVLARANRPAAEPIVNARRCFVLAAGAVVLFSVGRAFRLLGPAPVSVSVFTAVLVLIAWGTGPVPERRVGPRHRVSALRDGQAFAGEGGLRDLQRGRPQQPSVSGDDVTCL